MEHLGDITKISGYTAPTVDCIIGGSPCQDLSIAGKRAGLDGERSGLFKEYVLRIYEVNEGGHWSDTPTEKVCTGERCPMQVGYNVKNCKDKDCIYRTETEKGGKEE